MVGYALMLSIGRDALPGDEERYRPPARTALRRPARLEPVPGIRDQLEPPSGLSAVAAPRPVRIRLEGASPAQAAAGAGYYCDSIFKANAHRGSSVLMI